MPNAFKYKSSSLADGKPARSKSLIWNLSCTKYKCSGIMTSVLKLFFLHNKGLAFSHAVLFNFSQYRDLAFSHKMFHNIWVERNRWGWLPLGGDVLSLTQPYLLSVRLEFSEAHWKLLLKCRQSSQTQSAKTELTFLLLPFLLSPLYFHFMFLAPLFTFLLKPAIQGTCKTSPSLCEAQGTNRSNPLSKYPWYTVSSTFSQT